ncbi:substrate-binding periplasmic protein [Alteromonas facilis]|uniref:substrate-binding periplasmic protein n=1 Tax=Alteromonas facilis TaxID=2048004 RepID=UPI000C2885C7|nr:transporter substrate-binding domain-containing protein [Alteromonas facilis]
MKILHLKWKAWLGALNAFLLLTISPLSMANSYTVAVGWHKPPYVIREANSGFELELTRYIMRKLGHDISVIYVPFGRTANMLTTGQVDIGLTMNKYHEIVPEWYSAPYIAYQNVAITLASNDIALTTVDSLNLYSVIAFQTATTVLGRQYAAAVNNRPDYIELPDQKNQVTLLLRGSVDVAVMDENIFRHFRLLVEPELRNKDVKIHRLFPKSVYSAGIPDADIREGFNRELALAISDGTYDALLMEFNLVDLLHKDQ